MHISKRCCGCTVMWLLVAAVFGAIIYATFVRDALDHAKNHRRTPRPQYSVTSAASSPEATVAGNLLTADFRFTLKAHNPNRKKTIFYGNTTQVTLDCDWFLEITSSPLPLVGPSTLPPGNDSANIAVNLPVQNWPLPEDTASCDMILTMKFRAGFNQEEEEESKRPRIEVLCSPLTFNFQTKNFIGDYGTCSSYLILI